MNKNTHIMEGLDKIGHGRHGLLTALAALAAAALALPAAANSNYINGKVTNSISKDTTLTEDAYIDTGAFTFQGSYTLNLNGHKLTIKTTSDNAIRTSADNNICTITDGAAESDDSLPAEYEKLEYIESTSAGQYIDTGYKHTANTVVDIKAAYTGSATTCSVFGASPKVLADAKKTGLGMYVQASYFYKDVGALKATATSSKITKNTVYDYHLAKANGAANTATPSGGSAISLGSGNGTSGNSLVDYLFAMNENGSVKYKFTGRVWSCTIKEGSTEKRNFVPAKRKSDSVAGMFDTVEGKFYASKSGSFTAGPVVESASPSSSPETTGVVEIIVADGKSQGIIGNIKLSGTLKLVKKDQGTLRMETTAEHDYTGGTEVQAGTLKVNTTAANVFGAGGQTVSVGESGTIDLGGNSANLANYTIAMVEGAKIINSGADTATAIKVSGTFSPVATAGGFTVAPQNGTTIDFSRWNAAFPIVSPAFRFAANGTYPLNLKPTATMAELGKSRDGDGAYNGYLIGWSAAPSGVTFQKQKGLGDQFRIKSKANGLLLEYISGLGVILK